MRPLLESVRLLPRVVTRLRRPTWRSLGHALRGQCHACGSVGDFSATESLPDDLVTTWRLTPAMRAAMERRESRRCAVCRNNYRARQLARALVALYGKPGQRSLADLVRSDHFRSRRIVGIDMAFLSVLEECPGYTASNYMTSLLPAGRPDTGLPFDAGSLDLVVTLDTLEHVPRPRRVLEEIHRALVPGGRFVTIQPVILSRRTVTRCVVDETGSLRYLLSPSYHSRGADDSLVFVEFGIEILDEITAAGFDLKVYFYNLPADDYTWVAVCEKGRPVSAGARRRSRGSAGAWSPGNGRDW
jgi:SAM-dependent methyltransferase